MARRMRDKAFRDDQRERRRDKTSRRYTGKLAPINRFIDTAHNNASPAHPLVSQRSRSVPHALDNDPNSGVETEHGPHLGNYVIVHT
jgi:hypothetical protein